MTKPLSEDSTAFQCSIASIRLVATAPPLATYTVEIVVEGNRALHGSIGTYLSD